MEFQTDTVKKVHMRKQGNTEESDVYILSLIEHKSSVDYDITMQILKYMVCIWENETVEAKSKKKDYRYPPIFPIVYYEGSGEWTAARNFKDRVLLSTLFEEYIPDFTYKLVRTQDYSKEELLSREDAISLLMLLNKIQQAKDFMELSGLPTTKLSEILKKAPLDVSEVILSAVRSLCRRLNLTEEETAGLMKEMEAGNMGYLWENMEKMDIQLERRNTAEARKELEEARLDAAEQRKRAEEAEKKVEQEKIALSRLLVNAYKEQGMDEETIARRLTKELSIDQGMAEELLKKTRE